MIRYRAKYWTIQTFLSSFSFLFFSLYKFITDVDITARGVTLTQVRFVLLCKGFTGRVCNWLVCCQLWVHDKKWCKGEMYESVGVCQVVQKAWVMFQWTSKCWLLDLRTLWIGFMQWMKFSTECILDGYLHYYKTIPDVSEHCYKTKLNSFMLFHKIFNISFFSYQ